MIPITGPFTETVVTPTFYKHKEWFRQKRPHNECLPLWDESCRSFDKGKLVEATRCASFGRSVLDSGYPAAYNKAYARLVGQLGDNAGLGVNLAQLSQSTAMISARALQLAAFTRALIRRSPQGISAALHISKRDVQRVLRRKYGKAETLSDLWLEFWFGWKPLVSDIYTAMEVLEAPLPYTRLKARASISSQFVSDLHLPATEVVKANGTVSVRLGCDVKVSNPNVRLLQQLGLLNPGAVVWDAIPWSFVVDWFFGVSAFIGSLTDFAGLEIQRGYVVKSVSYGGEVNWYECINCSEDQKAQYRNWNCDFSGTFKQRTPVSSFPAPYLRLKLGMSPIRALTSISLLTQQLARVTANQRPH